MFRFRNTLQFVLGLGIAGVDDEVLEVPEAPVKVLAPLELASDFDADLAPMTTRGKRLEQRRKKQGKKREDVPSMPWSGVGVAEVGETYEGRPEKVEG